MTRVHRSALLLALLLALPSTVRSDDGEPTMENEKAPIPEPHRFVTHHTGTFGGRTVRYTATAGETYLRDDDGKPTASVFTFAYDEDGLEDPTTRPVTFVWNGGPGSASVWLHMGTFGPRRVVVPSDASDDGAPPYPVEENTATILDVTDLVFVDPVGTGFSRPLGEHEGKEFWGLDEDASSIAQLIRLWVTENGRWASPKYLLGESFGTTRAAAVAGYLESGREDMSLNGLVLISQALDYTGSTPEPDNILAFVSYLPTMAATARYHGRVAEPGTDLESFLAEVRRFATDEYAPALLMGSDLPAERRAEIAERLAAYTGLSREYVERADLKVLAWRFLKELLRDEGVAIGRLDGRYEGDDIDDTDVEPDGDPSSYGIDGAFNAAFHDYIRRELDVDMEGRPYHVSGGVESWNWRTVPEGGYWEPSYVDTAPALARAMRRNPELRVMVANGYYDFATPFFDAEITFRRHGIATDRVEMHYYEAGHMMYIHDPSRQRLMDDVRRFYGESSTP
ncbi:MAG: peptidase S10 [Thermoanaerobaculia bacterium]